MHTRKVEIEQKIAMLENELKACMVTADTLKITANGSFGKFGSKYSVLYAPNMLIQVTLTGQLSLLMLIEAFELAGFEVKSGNTDGIVVECKTGRENEMHAIVKDWEDRTGYNMEPEQYKAVYSKDVNNYIAVKNNGVKLKGIYSKPGLRKNPQSEICMIAIKELLLNQTPIEKTITQCKDFTKFVTVRTVKGGAVKLYGEGEDGLYLGKAVRWYYATNVIGEMVYAKNGNKVPKSDGGKPAMDLPATFPDDVDFDRYINDTRKALKAMGYQI